MVRGIEKLVKGILPIHSNLLEPVYSYVNIPLPGINEDILGEEREYPSGSKKKYIMGKFFESLTKGFYGGELRDVKHSWVYGNGDIRPDVVNDKEKITIESKANVSGSTLDLDELQFRGYWFNQFSFPERRFFYAIYRHVLRGIESQDRYEEEIVSELTKKTVHSVVLPLSILVEMAKKNINSLSIPYISGENSSWNDNLLIRSPTINQFLIGPEKILSELGFSKDDFVIQRYMSPLEFKVNGRELGQFPVMYISDKYHDKWVERFIEEYGKILREML